jgi:N-acyl-D-amino-acid deacylase
MTDLLIRGATVHDGTGAPGGRRNVAIRGGRIVPDDGAGAARVIDADGLVLAPGFVDVHTHDDVALIATPDMTAKVRQGVTTVVTGLCGYSAAPFPPGRVPPQEYGILLRGARDRFETFGGYLDTVAAARPAVNWLPLVGHSTLRIAVMDALDRPASPPELLAMQDLLDDALAAGAAGLSTGLAYDMASAATEQEVIALCRRMAPWGLHVIHLRDEADGLLEAVAEALRIGRAADVGTVFSHHKAIGPRMWGRTTESLALIDAATETQEVALDAYPYAFSSTSLTPERAARGGPVTITRSDPHPEAAGRTLEEIATAMGLPFEEAARALMPAGALYHAMSEEDVRTVLSHQLCMIGSDGLPFDPEPHPRLTGSFPRMLGRYVRDEALIALPEAIRRMTSMPADVFGLQGRGRIEPGMFADLVLFDAELIDEGQGGDPPPGLEAVLVAGQRADIGTGSQLRTNRRHEPS